MNKVAIIDYGLGNLDSVYRAVEECGGFPTITNEQSVIEKANRIILPGVGSFSTAMQNIKKLSLDKIIYDEAILHNIPLLGICLGMQLLAIKSTEGGETAGLGLIDFEVFRFKPTDKDTRIPHIGWNNVIFKKDSILFKGLPSGIDYYFVHSYYAICKKEENIIAVTPYCGEFVSAVENELIFGVQFHPEKSQKNGFQLIKNFLSI